jgi:hypothetical protein
MAFDYKRLTEITTIADTVAAVYTNPSATKSYIHLIVLHNTNSTAEVVQLHNVPDNATSVGTAAATNKFYYESMEANTTSIIDLGVPGLILETVNDTIQAVTTTASKVTIQIMGGTE